MKKDKQQKPQPPTWTPEQLAKAKEQLERDIKLNKPKRCNCK
jgi:hypothetical protein